ncbi:MAG TPA: exodeoxyribonuclease VII large subunit [Myxococcota bacterium]|nr:exodeoxyribonuclease VII large subunit [Myxococcota bacterium]
MAEQTAAGPRIYAVGELVAGLRRLLEDRVGRLWVVGQIGDLSRPRSGHLYFTLKDEHGQLRAALFRNTARRLRFEPEEGMEVLAYCEVSLYEPRGDLQLLVRELEPRGVGVLQLAYEQLRRRLEAEGLFEAARKRALPRLPRCVGVVTSASGAALRDVLAVTARRWPSLPILLAPARVQGPGAEREIAAALDALARHDDVSVVLLVRGGGSLEDLQAFNSELVARAIARCPRPVVAGIGHEVDVTIADFIADVRAPTPSAAAELAVPDRAALARALEIGTGRLQRALRTRLREAHARAQRAGARLRAAAPAARLGVARERHGAAGRALLGLARARIARERARLASQVARLDSLSPLAVLARGYALVRRTRDGAVVREAADAPPGETLELRVAHATLEAEVRTSRPVADPERDS